MAYLLKRNSVRENERCVCHTLRGCNHTALPHVQLKGVVVIATPLSGPIGETVMWGPMQLMPQALTS